MNKSIEDKVVLVTGIAGFIGSAVARLLISKNQKVVGIDNLSTGLLENIPDEVDFIQGDVQDEKTIHRLGSIQLDCIYHIAGQSSGEVSFIDPIYDLQTNCQSTLMLLDYARKSGCKNFIYASTMSVYGNPTNPNEAVTERDVVNPISLYAVGKLASENYMKIYSHQYNISSVALRLFNVYGPGQNMGNLRQGMVSIFLSQALNENRINVKGSRERFRDQVYIDDAANAFLAARQNIASGYAVYNISTGKKTTVEEVIAIIKEHLPNLDRVNYLEGTPGDQFGIYGSYTEAQNKLSWVPKVDFRTGFDKMFRWALSKCL
ncbi:NAD-dependent epimerase/dehydratase family protein [Limnospira platensis]|uniref:NAD-dependent epimerase/dehydratase family protein n=1 Tax=Limnospira platensis TaxID=118562 RepID=UPI00028040B3|nr:UDP-glucose 4-epimerase [Arthrospira platensis C1]UWU47493.1 UDP-glucose 4-epimerase [Arthrospira platensis C1]